MDKRPRTFAVFLLSLFLAACICGGKEARVTEQYAIDYPPPSFGGLQRVGGEVRVERFSVARAYRGHAMIYSPRQYREESYNYNRWIVNAGDMVGDHIVRDMRRSGLFAAVFSWCDREDPAFVVEGTVEEFMETDRGSDVNAVIALSVILLDRRDAKSEGRVMFQKTYHASAPMQKKTPGSLAESMSTAASTISKQVILDVYEGISRSGESR